MNKRIAKKWKGNPSSGYGSLDGYNLGCIALLPAEPMEAVWRVKPPRQKKLQGFRKP